jgi:phosphotransferase system enzyme I (PtsI)
MSTLSIFPTAEEMSCFADELRRRDAEKSRLRTLASLPAVTKSGKKVALYANIGSLPEAEAALRSGAEGIGLFRSEFLFIGRNDLPTEEEQFRAYCEAARLFAERPGPVVIRTLDIGADKVLPALRLGIEDNPALGLRGIRLCLTHPELFRAQLRAILRASAFGKVAIMLPMISTSSEIAATRKLLAEEKNRLRFEEVAFDESIELGIMIETPAAAIMSRELGRECDFFSVGTNDLFQYTLAADRQNQNLSYLYTEGGEAVTRLIRMAAEGIHASGEGKWLGICGEMAADSKLTEQLISLGADELSVSPPYIARVKERIREIE